MSKKERGAADMKEKAPLEFCSALLDRYKAQIKSIWVSENTINVLVLEVSKARFGEIAKFGADLMSRINRDYKSDLKPNILRVEDYFRDVLEGDVLTYSKIREARLLYDPSHFVSPIKRMVKTGQVMGTKEALLQKFILINQHFRAIKKLKMKVLDNIYMAVIETAQAALLARDRPIPTPKQVPLFIRKYFVNTGVLEPRFHKQCESIVRTFKDIEHEKRPVLSGKELDRFEKQAGEFIERLRELMAQKTA